MLPPGLFHLVIELFRAVFLRAVEHHVLEEMRDARDAGPLIARADFVEEVHRHIGNVVVFLDQDLHSVCKLVRLNFTRLSVQPGGRE